MDWKSLAFGSAFFAGLTAVLSKVGVQGLPSNFATFIRTIVILIFAAVLVSFRGEWRNPFQLETRTIVFLVLSALTTGFSWLCYYRALQIGPASLVSSIDKLSLVVVVVLSLVFLGERLMLSGWIGVGFILIGSYLIIR